MSREIEMLRRHLFEILTFVLLLAGSGYVVRTAALGRDLYRNERAARVLLEEIFTAQEARRLSGRPHPYLFLRDLIESQAPSSPLRRLAADLQLDPHSPPGLELYLYHGYIVVLGLQDEAGRIHYEPPDEDSVPEGLGSHFRALAWPQVYGETGGVFYFVDSRGYLFQGENAQGIYQGVSDIDLAAMDPYRDLLETDGAVGPLPLGGGRSDATGPGEGGYETLPESFRSKWSFIWSLREDHGSEDAAAEPPPAATERAEGRGGSSPR